MISLFSHTEYSTLVKKCFHLAPLNHPVDPLYSDRGHKRLADEVRSTGFKHLDLCPGIFIGSNYYDRNILSFRHLKKTLHKSKSIHAGHKIVQQKNVGNIILQILKGLYHRINSYNIISVSK